MYNQSPYYLDKVYEQDISDLRAFDQIGNAENHYNESLIKGLVRQHNVKSCPDTQIFKLVEYNERGRQIRSFVVLEFHSDEHYINIAQMGLDNKEDQANLLKIFHALVADYPKEKILMILPKSYEHLLENLKQPDKKFFIDTETYQLDGEEYIRAFTPQPKLVSSILQKEIRNLNLDDKTLIQQALLRLKAVTGKEWLLGKLNQQHQPEEISLKEAIALCSEKKLLSSEYVLFTPF